MGTAVLVSGTGTILESIVDAGVDVAIVASDRSCRALEVAATHHIDTVLVDRAEFGGFTSSFDREGFTTSLTHELTDRAVDLVCMAGFGTVLSSSFFSSFRDRVMNTHPSLLPAFRGWHAVRDALAAGVTETGCTVHFATESLDDGPILGKEAVTVHADDDESTLHERIKEVERRLYPATIKEVRAALDQGVDPMGLAVDSSAARP